LGRLKRDKVVLLAMGVLMLVAGLSLAAPWISEAFFHTGAATVDLESNFHAPSLENRAWWLGTDELGRSHLVRLLHGGGVSLAFASIVTLANLTLGSLLGLLAGYYRGRVDDLINWLITTLVSIPTIFLLLVISAFFKPSPLALALIFALVSWMGIARIMRGQVFALRERDFVLAARALGVGDRGIILNHILRNVVPIMIIVTGIDVGGVILAESALSYLGLGIQPPTPSWGNMLTNAQSYFFRAPWLVVGPGVMITATVLCLYIMGDGLRDALDPRLKE